jgi:hypothetical protein
LRDPLVLTGADGALCFLRIVDKDDTPHLLYQTTTDFKTFSSPTEIPCPWESPRLLDGAIDNTGQYHLVWVDRVEDRSGVLYSVYRPETQTCSPPIVVSSEATRISSPQVATTADGKTLIAWVEEMGKENGIYLAVIRDGLMEEPPIPVGIPALGIRVIQFTIIPSGLCLTWTSATPFPDEEQLSLQIFSLDGVPLSQAHPIGTLSAGDARPFCLATDPTNTEIYLAFVGKTDQLHSRGKQLLLAQYDATADRVETLRVLERPGGGYYLGRPWLAVGSDNTLHFVWEEGLRFVDIWYLSLAAQDEIPTPGCLSSHDGTSHSFPKLLQDKTGELHAVWITLEAKEEQQYTLRCRNTVYPAPLSFWQKVGIPEKGGFGALLYSLVYTVGITAWAVPIVNLLNLAIVLGVTLLLRRFLLHRLFNSLPTLSLLLPCAMLFCAFIPINPISPDPPLIRLVSSPLWFGGLLFVIPTLLLLSLVKLFRIDSQEIVALFGGLVFWMICFGVLSALPATLVGVYV